MIYILMIVNGVLASETGPLKATMSECLARAAVEQLAAPKGTTYRCEERKKISFQDLWMGRVARPPSDGVASRFNDRKLSREKYGDPSGEVLCAHRTEDFDRFLVVTNVSNGKSIDCPVRDRGPYWNGRVIDLYPIADKAIGCDGLCEVTVRRKGFE